MNTEQKTHMTRRDFLRDASVITLGGPFLLASWKPEPAARQEIPAESTSRSMSDVVLVRNTDVLDAEGAPRAEVVQEMLDSAVARLTARGDSVEGWQTLIRPDDVVGIKTNVWTPISTTAAVEEALKRRVMDAGVAEENIGILDRGVLDHPVFRRATALINARPMRTHHWSGVGSLIKNYIMFVPDPWNYHEDACSRLGEIWTYPIVKDKTRLNVLVMLTPQFNTVGPHGFSPRHVYRYYGLLVGFDPVAIDSIGVRIIQGMRNEYFAEERPLSPPANHIEVADTKYHLGTSDVGRINLIRIGCNERSFI